MEIKVLGPGCPKCHALEKTVREVLAETGIDAEINKITGIKEIAAHGIMLTPGLIINGKIKSTGKVLSKSEVQKFIKQEQK